MPKIRLDNLPLDQRQQARGGQAIVNKREVDPTTIGSIQARHGSVRDTAADSAQGLIAEGSRTYITSEQTFVATGNFTALFNLKWGTLATAGNYPILTLRAGTADSHYYQLSLNRTGEDLKFRMSARDADSTESTLSSALTPNSSGGVALKRVGNVMTIELDGTIIATDSDMSASAPTGPFYIDLLGTVDALNGFDGKPSIGYTNPILSNLHLENTDISVSANDDANREANGYDFHWKLDGSHAVGYIPSDTPSSGNTVNVLSGVPSTPVVSSNALRFNGKAGNLLIRHTPDMDVYYSTILNSTATGTFGFQIEGTRAIEPSAGRETILVDYGGTQGLCQLKILADGKVTFTSNGVSVTTDTAQFDDESAPRTFVIFCGRAPTAATVPVDTLYLRCEVGATLQEKNSGATLNYSPSLDLNEIPNIYLGSTSDASSTNRYKGSLTKFALYPSYYTEDAGTSSAEFSFDLTTDLLLDGSPNNRTAEAISHFQDENVDALYARGGIVDSSFLSVEGGVVLSGSGPINYSSKLTSRLASDVTSSRLGQLSFLESEGKVHVVNRAKLNARTLGLPTPSRMVSQQALGGGALSGAYSYGYRFVSDLGTTGPLLRLDPLKTSESARVMLGLPRDPRWSPLGDTYLVTTKNTGERGVIEASAPLTKDVPYPVELYSRVGEDLDDVELRETIWMRGAQDPTSNHFGLRTESNAIQFQTLGSWTMQASFQYFKPTTGTKYVAVCGIGPNGSKFPTWDNRSTYRVPDFVAYIDHANYGSTNGGRLVVQAAKRNTIHWEFREEGAFDERDYVHINQEETFKYSLFGNDDNGWWENGKLYNIFFIKTGEALRVYCQKKDRYDSTLTEWKELTDHPLAEYSNAYHHPLPLANFWDTSIGPNGNNTNVTRSATGFGFGEAARYASIGLNINSSGRLLSHRHGEARVGRDPAPPTSMYTCNMSKAGKYYCFRVWEHAKPEYQLKAYGERRFACLPDEPLDTKILIDLFPYVPDDATTATSVTSRFDTITTGVKFLVKNRDQASAIRAYNEPAGGALAPREIVLLGIGDDGRSASELPCKLVVSDIGDGSLVLQLTYNGLGGPLFSESDGRFSIHNKMWNPDLVSDVTALRETLPFVNDWDDFNWFSFNLMFIDDYTGIGGDERAIIIDSLCINGNQIFNTTLGSGRATLGDWTDGFIWLGNDSDNNEYQITEDLAATVHTASFRMWGTGEGPDPTAGTNYKYLLGRVSEDEYSNMLYYYKFQPADYVSVAGQAWSAIVEDYHGDGTADTDLKLFDSATLNRTGVEQSGVAFPTSMHETIAGIEIFRTASVPINDYEEAEDVQTALDIARSAPQFFLARIPVGSTQHIDGAPDSALGEQADYTSGYVPRGIVAALVWDSRLVILDENNRLWPSESTVLGWESFPTSVPLPNVEGTVTATINVQGERNQAMVLVLGNSSGTLLTGTPDAPISHVLGGGVGATSQRCVTKYNGIAFAYNGTLWAIQQGQAVDFGGPVQELLPTPANARLATSAKLSSLFVIDEVSGDCLRFHFPTKQWSVEERYATSVGDLEDGTDVWISKYGSWSKGNTAVYGDDVQIDTRSSSIATVTKSIDRVTTNSDMATAELHVGMPICIVDSAGVAFSTHIEVLSGERTITTTDMAASGLTDGAAGSATIYFGAGATGLLLDTGPMDVGDDSVISPKLLVDNLTGTGWEYAVHATKHPGDRDVTPALTYTSMSTDSGYRASGVRGRFQRVVIRNRKREAAHLPLLEIDLS